MTNLSGLEFVDISYNALSGRQRARARQNVTGNMHVIHEPMHSEMRIPAHIQTKH